VNGNDKAKKTFLNKKEAKVAKFQTPNEITLASHVEVLVSHGGDNPFLARRSPSAFATFASFCLKTSLRCLLPSRFVLLFRSQADESGCSLKENLFFAAQSGKRRALPRFGILFFREDFSPRPRKPAIYRLKGQLPPNHQSNVFQSRTDGDQHDLKTHAPDPTPKSV